MNIFTIIIFLFLTIISTLLLKFLNVEIKWYYFILVYFISSFLGKLINTYKVKFNVKEIKFEDNSSTKQYFDLVYIGKGLREYSIIGYLQNDINIRPDQLQQVIYKGTKQNEILPYLLVGEPILKTYKYQGASFDVNFQEIKEI